MKVLTADSDLSLASISEFYALGDDDAKIVVSTIHGFSVPIAVVSNIETDE